MQPSGGCFPFGDQADLKIFTISLQIIGDFLRAGRSVESLGRLDGTRYLLPVQRLQLVPCPDSGTLRRTSRAHMPGHDHFPAINPRHPLVKRPKAPPVRGIHQRKAHRQQGCQSHPYNAQRGFVELAHTAELILSSPRLIPPQGFPYRPASRKQDLGIGPRPTFLSASLNPKYWFLDKDFVLK